MDIASILIPVGSLSGVALILGLLLGYVGKIFHVEEDPKIGEVRDALPGANCGACGFPGCDNFAKAVAEGEAPVYGCPVGGDSTHDALAEIMGVKKDVLTRETAFVRCAGDCEKAEFRYDYEGLVDCKAMDQLPNHGHKACQYGCLGGGNCKRACRFGAIEIIDGIAHIDREKCTGCKQCVYVCPRNIIDVIPDGKNVRVTCNSNDKGGVARKTCSVACIGCRLCDKACEQDAIVIEDFLARVDYDKCIMCDACVEACPTKAIRDFFS